MATFFHLERGLICLVEKGVLIAILNHDRTLASDGFDKLRGRPILGGVDEKKPEEERSATEAIIPLEEAMQRPLGTWALVIQLPKKTKRTFPVVKVEPGIVPEALRLRESDTPSRPMESDPPPANDDATVVVEPQTS